MAFRGFIALLSFFLLTTSDAQIAALAASLRPAPQEYYRPCPLPRCTSCPKVDALRAPGVGFALETSHGAAVVRLHDGTFHNIALIEGDTSYTTLMRRLMTGPITRTPNPSDTYWDNLQYLKSRTQRLSNKLVGRPANPETAILASMVSKLLQATQTWLGDKDVVVAAVLSSPDLVELREEEVGDIFDFLKLKNLMDEPLTVYGLYATSAAYAGYGRGLCHDYLDAYACEREEWVLTPQRVLHVDLNSQSLTGTITAPQNAYHVSLDESFIDPNLGLGREHVHLGLAAGDEDVNQQYWTTVSDRIRELVKSLNRFYMPRITELVLTGPSAADGRFHAAIRAALHDLVADENVLALLRNRNETVESQEDWQSLFSFATARGAAEIAKRRQEGPVNCAQTDECRQRREHAHGERQSVLQNQALSSSLAREGPHLVDT